MRETISGARETISGAAKSLEDIETAVGDSLRKMKKEAVDSIYADVMGFYHAVDWSERWLLGLAAFHVAIWCLAIGTRKTYEVQMVLLVVIRAPRPSTLSGCCTAFVRHTERRDVAADVCPRSRARVFCAVDQCIWCRALEGVCWPELL